MANVKLKNVYKIYEDGTSAVTNINLNINDGEFIVLVGPSGCGKTTILRMIAGLEEVSEGEILIDDIKVNGLPPKDRNIAMVFQNYALYPHMTIFDNMAFGLKLRKIDKNEIIKRVNETAKILGLEKYLSKKPKALSGGQRQRVALGRAIVRNPKVFLFDEPLSNLDAKLRVQMRSEISALHKRLKTTMIYVTHDQVEAMTMGDRIIVMKDGIVQQIDTSMNLYENPVNKFVAGFIGNPAMNFIEGDLFIKDDNYFFKSRDNYFQFRISQINTDLPKEIFPKKIILGIRPEEIIAKRERFYDNLVRFDVVPNLIEPLGNQTLVYFKIGENNFISETFGFLQLEKNLNMEVFFNLSKLHLFDLETERRLIF